MDETPEMAMARAAQAAIVAATTQAVPGKAFAPPAEDPALAEMRGLLRRERNRERSAVLDSLGALKAPLSREQLLSLAPDVDAHTSEGRATLEAWHAANSRLFHPKGGGPLDPAVERARSDAAAAVAQWGRGSKLFNADAAVASIFKTTIPVDEEAVKAARKAELAQLQARGGRLFGNLNPKLLED